MTETLQAGTQLAHRRAAILRALLVAFLLLKLIAVGSALAQHAMLVSVQDGAELTTEQASANDAREQLIAILSLVLFLATALCWWMWQHRAYSNLRLIGSRETEFTPGWSVGYWFIPIVNLFRGYQITAELYRRSEIQNGRDSIGGLSGSPLVGSWWAAYLVWGGAVRFASTIGKEAHTLPTLISATDLELLAHVVGIAATILALLVIQSIDRFQQAFPVTDQITA